MLPVIRIKTFYLKKYIEICDNRLRNRTKIPLVHLYEYMHGYIPMYGWIKIQYLPFINAPSARMIDMHTPTNTITFARVSSHTIATLSSMTYVDSVDHQVL